VLIVFGPKEVLLNPMKYFRPFKVELLLLLLLFAMGCTNNPKKQASDSNAPSSEKPKLARTFNADTAYNFVVQQVAFGPRVPNTPAHVACADWMERTLKAYGATVIVQKAQIKDHKGQTLNIRNLIASFPTSKTDAPRVMVSAHWDSRPIADMDSRDKDKPIDGANDGGSGVAVLMEIARQLGQAKAKGEPMPQVAVDLMFWDAEDGGDPNLHDKDTYCLGAQYWANNPHSPGYKALWCINLDMVGASRATFPYEAFSRKSNPKLQNQVWRIAAELGYSAYFVPTEGLAITDDHQYIAEIAKIPSIDIIHMDTEGRSNFFEQWHTHDDNLGQISRETLGAVGQTVLEVLYREGKTS
jgi:glutaminyl-peptide cyclotransferase